jgi:hypothetical protein
MVALISLTEPMDFSFKKELMDILKESYFNDYIDNFDPWYYEAGIGKSVCFSLKQYLQYGKQELLPIVKRIYHSDKYLEKKLANVLNSILRYDFSFLYDRLSVKKDRELLLKILAYRAIGANKVKLTDTMKYRKKIK